MNTTPQPEGWIIVNGNTDALDWDGDLHPTKEDAIQSLTGPYQDYCREGEEVDGKHPWSDGYQILPVYREPLPKPERMASERPGGTNADTREASAVPQADQHGAEPTEAEVMAGAEAIARNHGYPSLSAASVYGLRATYLADARAALVAARALRIGDGNE